MLHFSSCKRRFPSFCTSYWTRLEPFSWLTGYNYYSPAFKVDRKKKSELKYSTENKMIPSADSNTHKLRNQNITRFILQKYTTGRIQIFTRNYKTESCCCKTALCPLAEPAPLRPRPAPGPGAHDPHC